MRRPLFSTLALLGILPSILAQTLEVKDAKTNEVIATVDPDSATPVKIGDRVIIITRKDLSATERKAREIMIPSMDFDRTPLPQACDFLRSRTRELDPELDPLKKGVRFRILTEELAEKQIDELKLSNVTLHYAATAIAEHAGIAVEFGEESIVFRPADPKAGIPRPREDKLRYTAQKARWIIIPAIDFENTWLEEAVDYLRQRAHELDPELDPIRKGLNIRVVGKDLGRRKIHSLQLRNTSLHDAMTSIAEMTGTAAAFEDQAVVFRAAAPANALAAKFVQLPSATLVKATAITFPRIDLDGASLSMAVQFLRLRARELDATESNPQDRGVNIIILDKTLARKDVSLQLRDASLHAILTELARQTGSTVQCGEKSIIFKPILNP